MEINLENCYVDIGAKTERPKVLEQCGMKLNWNFPKGLVGRVSNQKTLIGRSMPYLS